MIFEFMGLLIPTYDSHLLSHSHHKPYKQNQVIHNIIMIFPFQAVILINPIHLSLWQSCKVHLHLNMKIH